MYFERFLGLDDVAVLISGEPIRFTARDFSCDSAPAAQNEATLLLHARPATRQCVAMSIIKITRHFASCKPKKSLEVHQTLFPAWGWVWVRDYRVRTGTLGPLGAKQRLEPALLAFFLEPG